MIGFILLGHGEFSRGLASAMELIIGKQEYFKIHNFLQNMSQDDLLEDVKRSIEELDDCEDIVLITDIAGGTPYKVSIMLSFENEKINVISGANLPLLVSLLLNRDSLNSINDLIETGLSDAFQGLNKFNKENI